MQIEPIMNCAAANRDLQKLIALNLTTLARMYRIKWPKTRMLNKLKLTLRSTGFR
jgi:hypothetical protein